MKRTLGSNRIFSGALLCVLFLNDYHLSRVGCVGPQQQPHIIFIVADDLGWNDVGYHGADDVHTPNIDALAYNGLMLHRHYGMPTCTPSRAALLTGRYPIRSGMQGTPIGAGTPSGLPTNETLLPEYLKYLGYSTRLVGKWHVGCYTRQHLPTNRGFDTHFGYYNGYIGYFDGLHINSKSVGGLDARRNEEPAWSEFIGNYITDTFTDEAVNIIRTHDRSRPLFLELSHLAPHTGNIGGRLQVPSTRQNDQEFGHIQDPNRRLYAGMVKELDRSVGRVVSTLDETGMLENSIIVFIADNGAPTVEPLWETGNTGSNWPLRGEKASLHEGGIRTVATMWAPNLAKPASLYRNNFHLVDWLPTLYAAAGGDPEDLPEIDGVDHSGNIFENFNSDKTSVSNRSVDLLSHRVMLLNIDEIEGNEAIIMGRWKLIKNNRSSRLAFSNEYYGSNGSGQNIPKYNISAVLNSRAGRLLGPLGNATEDEYLRLRNDNRVLCTEYNEIELDQCYESYCLFNLHKDPCETRNVADNFRDTTNQLRDALDNFRLDLMQRIPAHFDVRADPKYWNNYWSPWVNEAFSFSECNRSNGLLLLLSLIITFRFLLIK